VPFDLSKIPGAIFFGRKVRDFRDSRRSAREVTQDQIQEFREWKQAHPVSDRPLVSVCVATYSRPKLLVERCIPSILGQTYQNIELIVVGDGAAQATVDAVATVTDPRCRFVNLPQNGPYPADRTKRWMVAGTFALNKGLALAQGEFVTHLDDDDAYVPERIEKLLNFARLSSLDFVYHPFWFEEKPDAWKLKEATSFTFGQVTTSSVFYRSWLKTIPWDINACDLNEPGDWNRFRKMRYLGVAHGRYPEPLLRHFREQTAHQRDTS
jgi:glycosyltransferase involved in cell wall biosynthesis